MSPQFTVAVLGATGAVGREMVRVLEERAFPVRRLVPLASPRSAGSTLRFRGDDVVVQALNENVFIGSRLPRGVPVRDLQADEDADDDDQGDDDGKGDDDDTW